MTLKEQSLWDKIPEKKWKDFKDAREIVRKYGFEYKEEWEAFINGKFPARKPLLEDIPVNPDVIYKHTGWKDWTDWLIAVENRKEYSSFLKARDFIRCLQLKGMTDWREYILSENPSHLGYNLAIPEKPDLEYQKTGWIDWDDWLGTGILYKDFSTTRNFVKTLNLKNKSEWVDYCNNQLPGKKPKPVNIFAYPEIAYRNSGWTEWNYWLGIV